MWAKHSVLMNSQLLEAPAMSLIHEMRTLHYDLAIGITITISYVVYHTEDPE
jgi:hypothetical protein